MNKPVNYHGTTTAEITVGTTSATDGSGIPQLDTYGFLLDPSNPASGLVGSTLGGLAVWSAIQTAAHIARPGGTWTDYAADMNVSYSFGVGATTLPTGYEAFATQAAQEGALRAMALYSEVSGIKFHESVDVNAADITYIFGIGSSNGGGWANYPSWSGGYVQVGHVSWEPQMIAGTYSFNLLLHELGHGLGLGHPGDYNGDSAVYSDADHFNDSEQYTNMSYWNEESTGASFSDLATLGLHDILAIQMEYGINWTTRSGDTVYGFNATAGSQSYDFDFDSTMAFCIWDGGGNDTLDFSGFVTNAVMDLRQGSFSSTGLETYNVSVAYGAVIENAVGGGGADRMRGNEVANILHGGGGNDVMYGGAETDAIAIENPRDFVGVLINDAPLTRNQYLSATNISAFSGGAFTLEMQVHMTRSPASTIAFASYAVGTQANEVLIEGTNNGNLKVTIRGVSYTTSINTESLIDGDPHRLSISWDQPTGTLNVYIDGTLADTGILQPGAIIRTGGTLLFGQEQDSLGGGFDLSQVFQGTIGDIRIFNDVRTAQEISDAAFADLMGTEQGLTHNWQVSTSDVTSVQNVVSGGTAIIIRNGGTINDTAPELSLVSDDDILVGGAGQDSLYGGAGADILIGDLEDESLLPELGVISLIRLNQNFNATTMGGGYNDHSLHQSQTFSPAPTAITFEMMVRIDGTIGAFDTLMAYSAVGEWDAQHFTLRPNGYGRWALTVAGTSFDTGLSANALASTQAFRLSLTWDSATGHVAIYRDGALLVQGTVAQGASIAANGNLSLFTGWDGTINGAVGDIRVWDHVRSQDEIYRHAYSTIASPTDVDGLIANWQVSGSGTLIDATANPAVSPLIVQNNTPSNAISFETADFTGLLNDTLDGGVGDDTLFGGLGHDDLTGGDGDDQLWGGEGADTLHGEEGIDWIYGGAHDDELNGDLGDDHLWGGIGGDTHNGGEGLDYARYDDDDYGSLIINLANPSVNTGAASGDIYVDIEGIVGSLDADVITGNANANHLVGGDGDDMIIGEAGSDELSGGDGIDNLWGGTGADTLTGGDGVDYARYDDANHGNLTVRLDAIWLNTGAATGDRFDSIEGLVGGAGKDIIAGNGEANFLFGATGDDMIYGRSGVDLLNGGAGADHLWGGAGADVLIGGDGFGVDYARYDDANWGNLMLRLDEANLNSGSAASGDTFTGIEGLVAGAANDVVIGNQGANYLFGSNGSDFLDGRQGSDYLNGGAGTDRFRFSTALNGSSNVDHIADFVHGVDDVLLTTALFTAIGAVLDAAEFTVGTAARDANDYVIYHQINGQLYYDADGNNAGSQILFATLTKGTLLDIQDFVIV